MANCYKCDTPLVPKEEASEEILKQERYASVEHIIPNFCGGQLKSDDLLCRKCNNELGTELEGELSGQLLFHELFGFRLNRGKQKDGFVLAYTQISKKEILINRDLKWKHYKPTFKVSEEGKISEFICQTREQAVIHSLDGIQGTSVLSNTLTGYGRPFFLKKK